MARYQGSIWRPTEKYGYTSTDTHTKGVTRVIIHSAEGYRTAMFGVLDGPRQASWHFSVMRNGEVYQHISTGLIAWTASSFEANDGSIQIEEEGKAGEALTNPQYTSTIALLLWIFKGYDLGTPSRETNLREHNEFTNTSCPSGRVPWQRLMTELKEADMDAEETQRMIDATFEKHNLSKWRLQQIADLLPELNQNSINTVIRLIKEYSSEGRTLAEIADGLKVTTN